MVNTIRKEVFLIMCSQLNEDTRYSGCLLFELRITVDYTLQTLCGAPHNVCNEEGKCNGMHPNRAVYGDNKEMLDVIFGPFFICDCSGESFGSLSDEQIETYKNLFRKPERFFVRNNKIVAVPYMPAAAKTDREER